MKAYPEWWNEQSFFSTIPSASGIVSIIRQSSRHHISMSPLRPSTMKMYSRWLMPGEVSERDGDQPSAHNVIRNICTCLLFWKPPSLCSRLVTLLLFCSGFLHLSGSIMEEVLLLHSHDHCQSALMRCFDSSALYDWLCTLHAREWTTVIPCLPLFLLLFSHSGLRLIKFPPIYRARCLTWYLIAACSIKTFRPSISLVFPYRRLSLLQLPNSPYSVPTKTKCLHFPPCSTFNSRTCRPSQLMSPGRRLASRPSLTE
ncbi:hypothetical protein V8E53_015582 [Lactarius tabidus]|jgi:hypothetical protein